MKRELDYVIHRLAVAAYVAAHPEDDDPMELDLHADKAYERARAMYKAYAEIERERQAGPYFSYKTMNGKIVNLRKDEIEGHCIPFGITILGGTYFEQDEIEIHMQESIA